MKIIINETEDGIIALNKENELYLGKVYNVLEPFLETSFYKTLSKEYKHAIIIHDIDNNVDYLEKVHKCDLESFINASNKTFLRIVGQVYLD